ncbi:MAG: hypothetical protein CM1200mP5_5580 [Candidatus Pelagibacterales bacterium]|nr:MAG: hypothetical protein CM1200mP5_5580 [Pelagibacterales bacterium]
MVKVSYEQKPYRKMIMQTFGQIVLLAHQIELQQVKQF